ncbi:hypothetical protein FHY34_001763 [Xanthomonas arboricola]|uniref:hypothetical protein n=1 Tax=Xanthomonas arboricola TaxID=56448 RepID=UPI0011B058AA|nr:hypothetical protein [Xanthomonas arboricola]MBB4707902.1 hypothetical protein [Xanthomonas arboricola]
MLHFIEGQLDAGVFRKLDILDILFWIYAAGLLPPQKLALTPHKLPVSDNKRGGAEVTNYYLISYVLIAREVVPNFDSNACAPNLPNLDYSKERR